MNTQTTRLLRILSFCLLIPLQITAIYEAHELFVSILALIAAAHLGAALLDRLSKQILMVWTAAFVLSGAALVAILLGAKIAYAVSFFPPVIIYTLLAIYFGKSLLCGQEPVITRLRRLEAGYVTVQWAHYTRILTIVWTGLFIFLLIVSALLSALSSLAFWTFFAAFGAPMIMLCLFFGEHAFRAAAYGADGRAHPWRTLQLMSDPHVWINPDSATPSPTEVKTS